MASWMKRMASLVTVLVLSGTPAVLAVCAAQCLAVVSHDSRSAAQPVAVAHPVEAGPSEPPAHEPHHVTTAAGRDQMPLGDNADARPASPKQSWVPTSDHSCCPDGRLMAVASVVAVRADARVPATTAAADWLVHAVRSAWAASPSRLLVARRWSGSAPSVLRI